VGDARAGPGADVEDLPGYGGEQAGSPLAKHGALERAGHTVVGGGIDPVLAHGIGLSCC
jgi:hypothetical protein